MHNAAATMQKRATAPPPSNYVDPFKKRPDAELFLEGQEEDRGNCGVMVNKELTFCVNKQQPIDIFWYRIFLQKSLSSNFVETVLTFSEVFTAHGVHYIFEKGQAGISRLFWIVIVIIGIVLAVTT